VPQPLTHSGSGLTVVLALRRYFNISQGRSPDSQLRCLNLKMYTFYPESNSYIGYLVDRRIYPRILLSVWPASNEHHIKRAGKKHENIISLYLQT